MCKYMCAQVCVCVGMSMYMHKYISMFMQRSVWSTHMYTYMLAHVQDVGSR